MLQNVSKNTNYLYIKNGEIQQFNPGKYEYGIEPTPANLTALRDTAIKCYRKWTDSPPYDSETRLEELNKQIEFINQKIHKYNEKLTSGFLGWFFRLFKMDKAFPYQVKVTCSIPGKEKAIQKHLLEMIKVEDPEVEHILARPHTGLFFNPETMKFVLGVDQPDRERGMTINGKEITEKMNVLDTGKTRIFIPARIKEQEYQQESTTTIEIV